MKALVWNGGDDITLEERPAPVPSADEVLIKVHYCGICGSEMHILEGGVFPDEMVAPPMVLGHEFSGVVAEVGEAVEATEIGDRVTAHPWGACGSCYYCQNGQENFCLRPRMSAGGFAEYVVVRERQVYPLPDNISMQQGALIEPFSIAVHAIEKANLYPGATAAIVGAGMIGLACLQLAVHAGAAMTCISEPILTKRQHAAKLGADYVIDPEKDSLLDSIQQHTDKRGVDSFIDAVGLPREIETGFHALKNDGTLVVVGVAPVNSEIRLNPFLIYAKEANIRGVNWSPYSFHKTISLLPKLEVSELISEVLPLEEFARAFDICRSGDTIKVLLKIGA